MVRIISDLRKEKFMNYYKEIKNLIEEKEVNDKVIGGSVNGNSTINVKVEHTGKLVANAPVAKVEL